MTVRVLVVDDDRQFCEMLSRKIRKMGHEPTCAQTLNEGLSLCRSGNFDVVYLDVRMPDGNGLETITSVRECPSNPEVIIVTGDAVADGAELAIRSGAWDYVAKASSLSGLVLPLERSLQYREAKRTSTSVPAFARDAIIGSGQAMTGCLKQAARAARSSTSILVTGETGTGKELVAWALHENSDWAGGNFVVVDCAALTATLVESTLFGHEKGAYTGADKAQEGLIRQAHGGTLFLDEIGELPLAVQKAFLRVLQERRYRPLGGKSEVESDFRLIAATNRDLEAMVEAKKFRQDLLFRLKAFHIEIPPLRDRLDDIPELTEYYVNRLCSRNGIPRKTLSPEFVESLAHYRWPGNVRELFNLLERAMAVAGESPMLFAKHLPVELRVRAATASLGPAEEQDESPGPSGGDEEGDFGAYHDVRERAIARMEHRYMKQLVSRYGKNVKEACRFSGLSRSRFYELLKKYSL